MSLILRRFALAAVLVAPVAAHADLRVSFIEGAPKDRFVIVNDGDCALPAASVLVDLSTSAAGLVFDVTGAGAGVQVFQPFEITEGATALRSVPEVRDGQTEVQLDLLGLDAGQAVAFTIDVDDTLGQRAITVSRAEIEGATVTLMQGDAAQTAAFTTEAQAVLPLEVCVPRA